MKFFVALLKGNRKQVENKLDSLNINYSWHEKSKSWTCNGEFDSYRALCDCNYPNLFIEPDWPFIFI